MTSLGPEGDVQLGVRIKSQIKANIELYIKLRLVVSR